MKNAGPRAAQVAPSGYSHLFRLVHWLLALSLPALMFSGFCIHALARPNWSLFESYPAWLPSWRMQLWHRVAGFVFILAFLPAFGSYLGRLQRSDRWGSRQGIHVLLLAGGALAVVSGVALIHLWGAAGPQIAVRLVHGAVAVLLSALLITHVILGLTGLRQMLGASFAPLRNPRWAGLGWIALSAIPAFLLAFDVAWTGTGGRTLHAGLVPLADPAKPEILPWEKAPALLVKLANGAGFDRGMTVLALRAFHDGSRVFIQASWEDPTQDLQYMPWRRTADGWEQLVSNPADETVFYEDKMSLLFPIEPSWEFRALGCAIACHAGGGRPYGYKSTAVPWDVWHWKSVRSDPVDQLDDKHWNADGPEKQDAGRHGDPKTSGGYAKNVNPGKTGPAFLPRDPAAANRGVLLEREAVPCTPELARSVPAGSIVPGIVLSAFRGDRGDVSARSVYEPGPGGGRWVLHLSRALATGSPHDVVFKPGARYLFSCAAFDHAAKRHAYHHAVYGLELAPGPGRARAE